SPTVNQSWTNTNREIGRESGLLSQDGEEQLALDKIWSAGGRSRGGVGAWASGQLVGFRFRVSWPCERIRKRDNWLVAMVSARRVEAGGELR
ncbi:unnamed protein product, partial [Urochloa humidicola]